MFLARFETWIAARVPGVATALGSVCRWTRGLF
jgi:hypothetical protein